MFNFTNWKMNLMFVNNKIWKKKQHFVVNSTLVVLRREKEAKVCRNVCVCVCAYVEYSSRHIQQQQPQHMQTYMSEATVYGNEKQRSAEHVGPRARAQRGTTVRWRWCCGGEWRHRTNLLHFTHFIIIIAHRAIWDIFFISECSELY